MSDYSVGDRVRLEGRVWHITQIKGWGWGLLQDLCLLDPDNGERRYCIDSRCVEPVGFRVIEGGPFPRLVTVNGEHVA